MIPFPGTKVEAETETNLKYGKFFKKFPGSGSGTE